MGGGLGEYKKKRRFELTPEPEGRVGKSRAGHLYVIQKHAAGRLHYDFRLELDGVLKSWAVPRGPSLDPSDKRLAVEVEDHPVGYGSFEGIIPEGSYGAGTVMLWDRGTWEPLKDPRAGLRNGRLEFRLRGEKLKGKWALVRMAGRVDEDKNNWLLIKMNDDYSRRGGKSVLDEYPLSVASGRTMKEIAAAGGKVWQSDRSKRARASRKKVKPAGHGPGSDLPDPAALSGARKSKLPEEISPELATLVDSPPPGDGWLHEVKFDGYRLISILAGGKVRILTRKGKDWTAKFGGITRALEALPVKSAVLDGEAVVLGKDGISDFQALQNALNGSRKNALHFFVFDILYCGGFDLTRVPLIDRKTFLQKVLGPLEPGMIRYSDHTLGKGSAVFEDACRMSLEGIVSKRAASTYVQRRTRDWLKVKCHKRQEFVIGGYKLSTKASRAGFRSLLLGYYDGDGDLVYSGGVGTGFDSKSLRDIRKELDAIPRKSSPFVNPPPGADARGVRWVRPELVTEVEFTEWTDDNILRHPSFKGLREDKPAREIVREQSTVEGSMTENNGNKNGPPAADTVAGVHLTHPDRVLYPDQGLTKAELARFYADIADWILPHVVNRPLTIVRCPGGSQGQCFYQKNVGEGLPEAIHGVFIEGKEADRTYITIKDLKGLISLVQIGVLEIHPWGSRIDKLERPDRMVFDLDPGEGVSYPDVVGAAFKIRDILDGLGLRSFVKTSGGKGLHVVVPLQRRSGWDEMKSFSKAVADKMVELEPAKYIATMSKAKRKGKIFIDYLRNNRDATAVAAYSTRARKGAPVSAPITWDELSPDLAPNKYNVANLRARLSSLKEDPWKDFFTTRQSITAGMKRKAGL
ncbi:MAG: DNA ligase D [Candidatus Dadabacteria bacterium]|nr:DNA ligase D [Candidatus Dadabacteria bacterium]